MTTNNEKLYSKDDLAKDELYIEIKEALPYFRSMNLTKPEARIRIWIQNGQLVGRVRNLSPTKNPRSNKYEVYVPDIPRFKKEIYS